MTGTAQHWDTVFAENPDEDLSWTQREPAMSLALLERACVAPDARVLDVGCGAGGLAAALVRRGWTRVLGLDIAPAAIARARAALGPDAARATWLVADARDVRVDEPVDVWHDRAVFHFLVEPADRRAYAAALRRTLRAGGHAIVATFAPDGPERCSGLPVARYAPEDIARELGLTLVHAERETHRTPWDAEQRFAWALMRRDD